MVEECSVKHIKKILFNTSFILFYFSFDGNNRPCDGLIELAD
jgi:hypothetical protein